MKKGSDYIGIGVTFFCHDGTGKFVMGKRSVNTRDEHGRWDLGGGGIEFGETAEDAVRREVREEYGAEARSCEFVGYLDVHREQASTPTHWVSLVFKVLVNPAEISNQEPDMCDEVRWFTPATLPADEHMHSQFPNLRQIFGEKLNLI